MKKPWRAQILAVMRLELGKTFFARRGFWVYLLAFAPVLLFAAHSALAPRLQGRLARLAGPHPASTQSLLSIRVGDTREQVAEKAGEPYFQRSGRLQTEGVRGDAQANHVDHNLFPLEILVSAALMMPGTLCGLATAWSIRRYRRKKG